MLDSSLTLLNPPYVGYQRNFVGWIKRSESTKKRKVSHFKLVTTKFEGCPFFFIVLSKTHPAFCLKAPPKTGLYMPSGHLLLKAPAVVLSRFVFFLAMQIILNELQ